MNLRPSRARCACLLVSVIAFASAVASAAQPALDGVWRAARPTARLLENGRTEPPLRDDARKAYAALRRRIAAHETAADPVNWCVSPGFPRIATIATPFEITVRPDLVAIHYEWNRWARLVELKADLDVIDPNPMGEAYGRWDGDALVIRSHDFLETTYLDNSGLPHGAKLVVTERLALTAPDRLRVHYTIDDPDTYTRPWSVDLEYRRQANGRIAEDVCLDRIRAGQPALAGSRR